MKSLRAQLSTGLAVSLVLLLALQWAVATMVIEHMVERQLIGRLSQDAENLLSGIEFSGQAFTLNQERVSAVYQRPFSGHYFVISAAGQIESSRSLWDSQLGLPAVRPGGQVLLRTTGPEQQPLLLLVHGYRKQGSLISVGVAQDLTEVNAGLRQFQLIHGSISFAILLLLLGLQYFIVTHALKPLRQVKLDMQRLERGEIEQVGTQGPQEIVPLMVELNRLLAAMRKKTRRSREALGNLAHALKTQLTLLNQLSVQPNMSAEMQSRTRAVSGVMHNVIERELRRARLLGASLPGKRLGLRQMTSRLVQTLQQMYVDKGLIIDWDVPVNIAGGVDEEDMLELLGNLLDNACKWARTQVRFSVSVEDDLLLKVEDDGPGCEPDAVSELTARGFRLDESKPGSGLGLAIVQDIVESYGGTMEFGSSPKLGGLEVEVRLPVSLS